MELRPRDGGGARDPEEDVARSVSADELEIQLAPVSSEARREGRFVQALTERSHHVERGAGRELEVGPYRVHTPPPLSIGLERSEGREQIHGAEENAPAPADGLTAQSELHVLEVRREIGAVDLVPPGRAGGARDVPVELMNSIGGGSVGGQDAQSGGARSGGGGGT